MVWHGLGKNLSQMAMGQNLIKVPFFDDYLPIAVFFEGFSLVFTRYRGCDPNQAEQGPQMFRVF